MIKRDLIQNDSKLLEAQKQCGMKSNGESKWMGKYKWIFIHKINIFDNGGLKASKDNAQVRREVGGVNYCKFLVVH
jgi:hypothetical protein